MPSLCRLCLSSSASPFKTIAAIEEKYFQLILPEIDIQLVQSPMFCQRCVDLLQTTYTFKSKCIKTEKMLKLYASNCGGGNLLLSDVLQNHFFDKNQTQSGQNDVPALLNKGIKVESDNDSVECDLDFVGEDVQSCPEIEIKLVENKINFEVSRQQDTTTCKGSSDDESNTKLDRISDCKKPFRCVDCGNSFRKRNLLINHIKRHYEHPHCFTCSRALSNRSALKRHLSKVHNIDMSEEHEEQLYTINIDKEKLEDCIQKHLELYKSMVDLKGGEHSDDEEPFKCNICKKGYHKKKFFLEHIRIHFTKSDCGLCGERFNNTAILKGHLSTSHQIDVSDDVTWREHITVVVDVLEMEEALKEYIKVKEIDDEENKSDGDEDLEVDKISIPSELSKSTHPGQKSLICDYCQKGFLSREDLQSHISACQLGIYTLESNFTCDACGFTTTNKLTLILHIRTHTGERPFKCNSCDNAFAQSSTLRSHMLTVHSTERLFTCEYCSKSFKMKGPLYKHIRGVHMVDKIEKKFICNQCGKKFPAQSRLNAHLKWHKADRPFSCDICGKSFVTNHSVKKHKIIHFEEKPYKCEICGKGFHQKYNRKIHMKVHGSTE